MKGGAAKKGADDDFSDFTFKEGTTAVLNIHDIFVQEKGKDAFKKIREPEVASAPKVKGGAKGKKKAVSKAAAKGAKAAKKGVSAEPAGEVRRSVDKILKYTPSKSTSVGKKETPQKGKVSTKKSVTGVKKQTPAMPSPGGKKSTKTTDQMTMAQFKQYLDWHEKGKGKAAKASTTGGKVLGKRSAGKASTASGKTTSRGGKRATR